MTAAQISFRSTFAIDQCNCHNGRQRQYLQPKSAPSHLVLHFVFCWFARLLALFPLVNVCSTSSRSWSKSRSAICWVQSRDDHVRNMAANSGVNVKKARDYLMKRSRERRKFLRKEVVETGLYTVSITIYNRS